MGETLRRDMEKYKDILGLPHPISADHTPMPVLDRAAQFAPFSALSGYEQVVQETARLTEEVTELTEDQKAVLDEKLWKIHEKLQAGLRPVIQVTYFVRDERKAGGAYQTLTGAVKRIDAYGRSLVMADGKRILTDRIVGMEETDFGEAEEGMDHGADFCIR